MIKLSVLVFLAVFVTASCSSNKGEKSRMISSHPFGQTPAGETVELYTLRNAKGAEVDIATLGGVIVSIKVPDRSGTAGDIVLGFPDLAGYLKPGPYFGAIIGRYANRIAGGKFALDGVTYTLAKNNGENSLHGGNRGFDKALWKAKVGSGASLELTYLSKDGEEGYPGNLTATVVYSLNDNNELKMDYSAVTDKDTVVNLTNHSYFNLAGQGEGDVLAHQVTIHADRFTPVDKSLIPTGELRSVAGTPFDFRQPHAIGERINSGDEQLVLGRGYDHNFVLNRSAGGLALAARVTEPKSGRVLDVLTDQPGVQLYTGNFLDGTIHGKGGKVYGPRAAFCLETQHFPDSPNHPSFPPVLLKPGERYHTTTVFRFAAAGA